MKAIAMVKLVMLQVAESKQETEATGSNNQASRERLRQRRKGETFSDKEIQRVVTSEKAGQDRSGSVLG